MIYLTLQQAQVHLRLGVSIEQWIKTDTMEDYTIIEWIRIDRETDGSFSTIFFQSFDEGDINFLDIYEFSQLDPDLPFGLINTFESAEESIEYAITIYGCKKDKFINRGMIQEEYKTFLLQKGTLS